MVLPELILAGHAVFNTVVLQSVFRPMGVGFIPRLREYSRSWDRRLEQLGVMGGLTSLLLFSQMFNGIFGTECGPHLAVFSWLHYRLVYSIWLDCETGWVSVAIAYIYWLNVFFVFLYFFCAIVTALQMRSAMGQYKSRQGQTWNAKLVAYELLLLVLSVFGAAFRDYFPGVKIERGILYDKERGLKVDVYYPDQPVRDAPVLFFLHGGSWVSGKRANVPSLLLHFVAQGGVCVSATYRLAPKNPFPAQIIDGNNALRWVRDNISRYGGDPDCIIVSGCSAGAHLTALMSSSTLDVHGAHTDSVRGVVSIYGVFEWGLGDSADDARFRKFLSHVVLGKKDHPDEFRHASPYYWVEKDGCDKPVLLLHGTSDNIVGVDAAVRFNRLLKSKGAPVTFIDLVLAHHAFDFFHSLRSLVVNHYTIEWILHVAGK